MDLGITRWCAQKYSSGRILTKRNSRILFIYKLCYILSFLCYILSFLCYFFSFFPALLYIQTHTLPQVESRILSRIDHLPAEFCKNSVFSTEFCINTKICIYVFLIETEVFLRILFKIRIMNFLKRSCILSKEYWCLNWNQTLNIQVSKNVLNIITIC